MVHARPFSFTDEAINVSYPSTTRMSRIPSISGPITGPASADPALLLFQLRHAQSQWYQALFQSVPTDPLPDAATFVWQMCHDMREWAESLPDTLPTAIREMFDLELRYSYVYCIAPSARAPHMTAYGRMLIFEHAIAYVDRVYDIAHASLNASFYTYHDALRVYFIGSQFLAVLRDAGEALLAGASVPVPLTLPGKAPPPPIPVRLDGAGVRDNLDRSARCLERVSLTLEKWGERWGDALSLRTSFDMLSREMVDELRNRKAMREVAAEQARQHLQQQQHSHQQYQQNQQHQHQQQQHQLQQQQLQHQFSMSPGPQIAQGQGMSQMGPPRQPQRIQEVRWVDVDVAQIIRGGGGS